MSYFHEACGQDMLEKAPDELDGIEGDLAVAAFLWYENRFMIQAAAESFFTST